MAIRVAINHKTAYRYDRAISLSPHIFRLRPAPHARTPIEAYSLKIFPEKHFINWQQDPFGNFQARVVFPEKTNELRIEVELIARMVVINPFDFFVEESAETYPFSYGAQLTSELTPYLEVKEDGPLLDQWVARVDRSKKNINDFLVSLNHQVNRDIGYNIRLEPGVQTCETTLATAFGSCRDSAWLLVQILRKLGLAARFVSGYLIQLTADIPSLDGPSGPEKDFTDLHAWTEVYIPGAGWVGLDPTSGLFAGEGHIPLACTPDYRSAAPVVGATDPAETEFSFSNTVTRIHEDPRVTKPYTEEQWAAILATGYKVDADFEKNDLRLTMGGEPTFVSVDDMESDQWNTAADGPEKRERAQDLIYRLREKFGPGGMLHFGQGKWYPGEPLPRWQYGLFWRKDGQPIWKNPKAIADENPATKSDYKDAERFIQELSRGLALDSSQISTAYEDVFYFLWSEGKLPVNIDPLHSKLDSSSERKTLARLLDEGLGKPAGYVLPLRWNHDNNQWQSCRWIMKREQLFLIPGNSPLGLRLPLESLAAVAKSAEPHKVERSLFEDLPALGNFQHSITGRYGTITDHTPVSRAFLKEKAPQKILQEEFSGHGSEEILYEDPGADKADFHKLSETKDTEKRKRDKGS